jgi:hypothetical protein
LKDSKRQPARLWDRQNILSGLGVVGMYFISGCLAAQDTGQDNTQEVEPGSGLLEEVIVVQEVMIEDLPGTTELAAALADREIRTDTLLTMIAVAQLLEYGMSSAQAEPKSLVARFREERAWLDRLAKRYPVLPSRGSHLDPAAWFVMLKLNQHGVTPGLFVSPLGPEDRSLMRQLFDRSSESLAAAVLPEAIQRIELQSAALWSSLLAAAMMNDVLLATVLDLHTDWFEPWMELTPPAWAGPSAPESPTAEGEEVPAEETEPGTGDAMMDRVIDDALTRLMALANSTIQPGPGDIRDLAQLRIDLISAMPRLADPHLKDAEYILVLATAIDGLNDGKYLAFTESLLWVISDMLIQNQQASYPLEEPLERLTPEPEPVPKPEPEPETLSDGSADQSETVVLLEMIEPPDLITAPEPLPRLRIPRFLAELLPRLSNTFSREFAAIDSRINSTLAAAFDAVQYLQSDRPDPERLASLRQNIGDTIAQMVLMVREMNYYFDQPVRRQITETVESCTRLAANQDSAGPGNMTREQFDGCLASLVDLSSELVSREELAGDPDGPFGEDQLRRELMMPPWQRINFSLGYLHERFTTACDLPDEPIPNPLEWSGLATLIVWFARQSPVYFQTPENEALIDQMRQRGFELLELMEQQVDCISGEGAGINDPVMRSLADYRKSLQELVAGVREAELVFREENLKPGADIVLQGGATQQTAYRREDMMIGPCEPDLFCEMTGELEATRALIGLFPDAYLIADQSGLGEIEICYENVRWVERRAEPVRPDDPHVANYYGKLSFDLMGRYREKEQITRVFGANFVSPDEYHYLFAAANEEVAGDSCPMEWVGSKIVTNLGSDSAIRVVPDRLTYLAGARKKPSEIINANWGKGAEWRDWFVTGLGVTPYEFEPDLTLPDRINQHLQSLYQAEQSALYISLLRPQARGGRFDDETLLDLQEELTTRKALVRSYINLFYPDKLIDSDEIRASLEGYDALLDTRTLRRFRDSNVAVYSINKLGISRLEAFQAAWNRQPEVVRRSGSVSTIVAHALMRLNALYLDFFAVPAEPVEVRAEVTPAGG